MAQAPDDIKADGIVIDNEIEINNEAGTRAPRGPYICVSPAVKLIIAKQAARGGIHKAIENNAGLKLKYMTVKLWRDKYLKAKREHGVFQNIAA